jgi:hypothetical protein
MAECIFIRTDPLTSMYTCITVSMCDTSKCVCMYICQCHLCAIQPPRYECHCLDGSAFSRPAHSSGMPQQTSESLRMSSNMPPAKSVFFFSAPDLLLYSMKTFSGSRTNHKLLCPILCHVCHYLVLRPHPLANFSEL